MKELLEENEYYKTITNKFKSQLDETKDKMKFYQEENLKIMEQKKNLEEKQNLNKFASQSFKSQLQSKENEINILREEMRNVDSFRQEKPKLEKKILELQKQSTSYKEDLERRGQRIKDMEKMNLNNKATFEQEIENLTNTLNKKIKALEQENSNLRKQEIQNKDKASANLTKSSAFLTETKIDKKDSTTGIGKDIEELKSKNKSLEGMNFDLIFRRK